MAILGRLGGRSGGGAALAPRISAPRISSGGPKTGGPKFSAVRGPEGGSFGGGIATFKQAEAAGLRAPANKFTVISGREQSPRFPKANFGKPGIQNTFRPAVFGEFGTRPATNTDRPTFSSGRSRYEGLQVSQPTRSRSEQERPRLGSGFIRGLEAYKPPAASSVREGPVFSTTLPNRDSISPVERPSRSRFETPMLNTWAELSKRSADRDLRSDSLRGTVSYRGVESVRRIPDIGDTKSPVDSRRVAQVEFGRDGQVDAADTTETAETPAEQTEQTDATDQPAQETTTAELAAQTELPVQTAQPTSSEQPAPAAQTQPSTPAETSQPPTPAPPVAGDTVDKDGYIKVKGKDDAGTGMWLLLTDDNGAVNAHYAKNDAKDGFAKVKGVMKEENGKKFLEISELTMEG